mmetsp:Transcript_87888/g.253495  ORF Transcript_87888/g.253495 Transcript_87888/m.253495 type:complete len:231 (-) Transcript_87888:514-1206(-)
MHLRVREPGESAARRPRRDYRGGLRRRPEVRRLRGFPQKLREPGIQAEVRQIFREYDVLQLLHRVRHPSGLPIQLRSRRVPGFARGATRARPPLLARPLRRPAEPQARGTARRGLRCAARTLRERLGDALAGGALRLPQWHVRARRPHRRNVLLEAVVWRLSTLLDSRHRPALPGARGPARVPVQRAQSGGLPLRPEEHAEVQQFQSAGSVLLVPVTLDMQHQPHRRPPA